MVATEGGGTGERNTTEIGEFSGYLFLWLDKKDLFKSKDRDNTTPYKTQTSLYVTVGYLDGWEQIILQNVDVSDNIMFQEHILGVISHLTI